MYLGRILVSASLCLLAAACAGSSRELRAAAEGEPAKLAGNSPNSTKPTAEDQVVCAVEYATGSHIPETVCRHVEQTERNRKQTQDVLDTTATVPVLPGGSSGGGR